MFEERRGARSPGSPGDGGSWLWPLWRRGEGQLPNRLPKDCRRHGTSKATHLKQRRRAASHFWGLRPSDATWTWAWDSSPAIQRHTDPGWVWTREVSLTLFLYHICLTPPLPLWQKVSCFHFLVALVVHFYKSIYQLPGQPTKSS